MISLRFITLLLIITVSACTTTDKKDALTPQQLAQQKGYELGEPVEKIMNYRLNGWNYVNTQALIISSTGNQRYLVTLRHRCQDLMNTEVIGSTSTGNALQANFDAFVVSTNGSRRGVEQRCYIDSIYKLSRMTEKPEE